MSGEALLPARYYGLLCDWLKSIGVDVDRMLSRAGIDPKQFFAADALLTLPQAEKLVGAMVDASGRPDLGFELGKLVKLGSHEILGFAMLSSPTLDHAMRLTSRFYRLITPTFRMTYRRTRQQAELEFTPVMPMQPDILRVHLEAVAVGSHEIVKSLLGGRMQPYDMYMSYPEPPYRERYRQLSPVRCHFEALPMPGIVMKISAEEADRPLALADRTGLRMAEARCEELLRRFTQAGGLADWVRMMLTEAHEGMPTLDELAHILHVTSRTLDRRLHKEGHRFLALAKQVRLDKARRLLRSGLSVTQVALQLGYHDVANFTRAFKRDSGMNPSDFLAGAGVSGR